MALSPEDEEALGVVRGVFQLLSRLQPATPSTIPLSSSSGSVSTTSLNPAAAAAEAVANFAAVAGELQPLLPELLPGVAHTGELFVRAFVRRSALRVAEAFSASEDYEQSMAALGFMPSATAGFSGRGFGAGAGFPNIPNSSNQFGARLAQPAAGMAGGSGMRLMSANSQQQQQQQQQGQNVGSKAIRYTHQVSSPTATASSSSSSSSITRVSSGNGGGLGDGVSDAVSVGLPTAGQLVTGLIGAPLLMVLTPLAMLHEQQRKRG